MQYVKCVICNAEKTSQITIQNNYSVVRCTNCGLVYLNPRPSKEALMKLYNGYHRRNGKDEHIWAMLMKKNFRNISSLLNRTFPKKGSLLDIGCGYGHFVETMRDYGWTASGIEPSSGAFEYARAKGLNVLNSSIDDINFPEGSFDVITAFYVLEHLCDPLAALKKISMMLKRNGILVLRIPHTTPIVKLLALLKIKNNLYDAPFHLYDFSPATIRLLLEKAGFSSVSVFPGSPTSPKNYGERTASVLSGNLAQLIFSLSMGRLLLPGVSKTVIAQKGQP